MHSTIFQISRERIDKQDYIKESKYYENSIGRITDYAAIRPGEREAEIEYLRRNLEGIAEFDGDSFCMLNKKVYFLEKYSCFKKELRSLSAVTIDDFISAYAGQTSSGIWKLRQVYENQYGAYVDDNYGELGLITFDEFMRTVDNGDKFYIGAVLDYHI